MSVIKKAVADLKEIKNTVSKVANKEVIEESKKHLDNKIAQLLEGEDISNDDALNNTPEEVDGAGIETQGEEHNVDFINSILNDVDIEALINAEDNTMPASGSESDETKLTADNNDTEMSEFNTGEEKEPISQEEIKTEVENLEPKEGDNDDTDDFLNNLSEEEISEILKEIESEESTDVIVDNDDSEITDADLDEAINALGSDDLDVDTEVENNTEVQDTEIKPLNIRTVEAFAKYLIQHEGADLVDSNNQLNIEALGNKLTDKFNPANEEQEYQIFDIAERIASQFEKEGEDDIEEGYSKSFRNAKSTNVKPSQYAEYNKDKEPIHEGFEKLKSLAEKLIAENTELKKTNAESLKSLDKIKNKLYEATVSSYKTSYVNQMLLENTLSDEEKTKVIKEFMSVSTIEEAKTCYGKLKESLNSNKTLVKESINDKITRTTILATDEINSKALNEAAKTQTNPLYNKWKELSK